MKRIGKIGKKWLKIRKEWLSNNPPDFDGYYICYICHKSVPSTGITLDHIKPRGAYPQLRFDVNNLAPCCWQCNIKKGSKHSD